MNLAGLVAGIVLGGVAVTWAQWNGNFSERACYTSWMQTKTRLKPRQFKGSDPNQAKDAKEATPNPKGAKEAKPDKGAKQPTAFNKSKTGKERWKARKMSGSLSRSKTPPEALHTNHIPWL